MGISIEKQQDIRFKIEDTLKYPYCAIGLITGAYIDKGNVKLLFFGTGSLIANRTVLTCAHNCFDR
jgi:V8-like Glu-specific endopeptidase